MKEELDNVAQDIDAMKDLMIHIVYDMLDLEITNYPVFIMSTEELSEIGRPFIKKDVYQSNLNIRVSHLEELVSKQIVTLDKVDSFKSVYKNPREFFCILFIQNESGNFIFRPFTV